MSAISRIEMARPSWSSRAFTASTLVDTSTETAGITGLDLGTVSLAGAPVNAAQKGLTLEFADNFNDSVYSDIRLWLMNQRNSTAYDIKAALDAAATFSAVATTAITGGARLKGNPYDAAVIKGTAAGAASVGTDEYDPTNNRIRSILIQLAALATSPADLWTVANLPYCIPTLVCDFARTDWATTGHREGQVGLDLETGHEFSYDCIFLYYVETMASGQENWIRIDDIREETLSFEIGQETVDWMRCRPSVVFHQAVSSRNFGLSFNVANPSPEFMAQLVQRSAQRNSTTRTMDYSFDAKDAKIIDRKWVVEFRSQGGYITHMIIPRATMILTGFETGEWLERGVTLTAKAANVTSTRSLVDFKHSDTPVESAYLPLNYSVTA